MPLDAASHRRWSRADLPGWMACASRSAPISRSGAGDAAYRCPLTLTLPDVGASRPRIIRIVVDLPAPLGPRKPVTRPGSTTKSIASTAFLLCPFSEAKRLVSWWARIMGPACGVRRPRHIGEHPGTDPETTPG